MGTEFLEKTRKPIRKTLDQHLANLGRRDLFTPDARDLGRGYTAKKVKEAHVCDGESVLAETSGSGVVLKRMGKEIGRSDTPSTTLKARLAKAGGIHPAVICGVGTLSPTIEFKLSNDG